MARLPRVELSNMPQHIIQRGNNRQACFASEQDFTANERQSAYRELFKQHIAVELLTNIHDSAVKGLALGNDKFKENIEFLSGRRVTEGKRGRPKKQVK